MVGLRHLGSRKLGHGARCGGKRRPRWEMGLSGSEGNKGKALQTPSELGGPGVRDEKKLGTVLQARRSEHRSIGDRAQRRTVTVAAT